MKKTLLILAASISVTSMLAQGTPEQRFTNTMNKGVKILPQAKDFAIGIDATPGLTYLGNIFNGNTDNNAGDIFSEGIEIRGKYFLEDNAAIRVTLAMQTKTNTTLTRFNDPTSTETEDAKIPKLNNKHSSNQNIFSLTAGYEMRRGYGKLQGFYGPQVGLGRSSNSETDVYALEMSKKNVEDYGQPSSRHLKTSNVNDEATNKEANFNFCVGAFAGVEYFVLPKLSIGGEVSFGLKHKMNSNRKITTESWTAADGVKTKNDEYRQGSNFNLSTRTKGALFVNFHF